MTAPRYKDPRTVLEEVERYLDSADRLSSNGKHHEAMMQVRRARAVIYSHLDGGHSISQTTLHSWRPWYVRRGRLGKLTGLYQNHEALVSTEQSAEKK